MNSPSSHTKLDHFIQESLKNIEADYHESAWHEMEPLLGQAPKSLVALNPKYLLTGACAAALIATVFFLVRMAGTSGTASEQVTPAVDTAVNTFSPVDPAPLVIAAPEVKDTLPSEDTIKDASATAANTVAEPEITSPPETTLAEKISKEKQPVVKEPKKNKKNSLAPSIIDTGFVPETLPPPDTAKKEIQPDVKKETSSATDTTAKPAAPKKKSKKGKSKSSDSTAVKQDSIK